MSFGALEAFHHLPFARGVATIVPRCFPSGSVGGDPYRQGFARGRGVSIAVLWHADSALNQARVFPNGKEALACAYFLDPSEVIPWVESLLGEMEIPDDRLAIMDRLVRTRLIQAHNSGGVPALSAAPLAHAQVPDTIRRAGIAPSAQMMQS